VLTASRNGTLDGSIYGVTVTTAACGVITCF